MNFASCVRVDHCALADLKLYALKRQQHNFEIIIEQLQCFSSLPNSFLNVTDTISCSVHVFSAFQPVGVIKWHSACRSLVLVNIIPSWKLQISSLELSGRKQCGKLMYHPRMPEVWPPNSHLWLAHISNLIISKGSAQPSGVFTCLTVIKGKKETHTCRWAVSQLKQGWNLQKICSACKTETTFWINTKGYLDKMCYLKYAAFLFKPTNTSCFHWLKQLFVGWESN